MHKAVAVSSLLSLELVDLQLQCCVSWCTRESARYA